MPVDRELLTGTAVETAPLLLGGLVRSRIDGIPVLARITEVEAYEGEHDPASHAYRGPTKRTAVMFGEAAHLYCYFVYGMHWCANVVCGTPSSAAAVLLRAAEIVDGESAARSRGAKSVTGAKLASGPARLTRALGLSGAHSGLDLLDQESPVQLVALAPGQPYESGPRVGIAAAAEVSWRFWLPEDPTVSAYRAGGRKRVPGTRQTGQP